MDNYQMLLAVEDKAARTELKTILTEAGHTVAAEATNRGELLGRLGNTTAQVALISERLASEKLGDIAAATETPPFAMPFLLVADGSNAETPIADRLCATGAFGVLTQPFRADDVLASVCLAVERFEDMEDCHESLEKLEARLADRITIERAKGVLMKMRDLTEEEAFRQIHFTARRQNRKMRTVAEEILNQPIAA